MPASYRRRGDFGACWLLDTALEIGEGTHRQALCLQAPTSGWGQSCPARAGVRVGTWRGRWRCRPPLPEQPVCQRWASELSRNPWFWIIPPAQPLEEDVPPGLLSDQDLADGPAGTAWFLQRAAPGKARPRLNVPPGADSLMLVKMVVCGPDSHSEGQVAVFIL